MAVVIAVCGLLTELTFRTETIIIFGFLVAMFIQTFAPLLYAYTPECYPTHIRNSGTGLRYGVGRLCQCVWPAGGGLPFQSLWLCERFRLYRGDVAAGRASSSAASAR